jgi:hypothetical protein
MQKINRTHNVAGDVCAVLQHSVGELETTEHPIVRGQEHGVVDNDLNERSPNENRPTTDAEHTNYE